MIGPTCAHFIAIADMLRSVFFLRYRFSETEEGYPEDPLQRIDVHYRGKNIAHLIYRATAYEADGPWVSGIYVHSDHRRKGLGSELLRRVENKHPGQRIRLRARPYKDGEMSLTALMEWYQSLGYQSYDPDEPSRMVKALR